MASTRPTIQRVQRPAAGRSSVMVNDQAVAAQARIQQGQRAGADSPSATYDRLRQKGAPRPRVSTPGEVMNAKLDEILTRIGAIESNQAKLNHRLQAFRTELLGPEDSAEEGSDDDAAVESLEPSDASDEATEAPTDPAETPVEDEAEGADPTEDTPADDTDKSAPVSE